MLQSISIIGNVVADAELRKGRDGRDFVSFKVAVTETVGDEKRCTYYDVSCPSSPVQKYLKKGQLVYVSGKVTLSAVLHEGRAYLNARISAKDIELCGGQKDR